MASSYGFGTRSRPAPLRAFPVLTSSPRPAPNPSSRNRKPYTGVTPTSPFAAANMAKGAAIANYIRRRDEGLIEPSGDPITSAVVGTQGVINLFRQDLNPEGLTYPTRMVPTVRGGMLSGGPPNVGQSVASLGPVMISSLLPRDKTAIEQQAWNESGGNPREYKLKLDALNKQQQAENSIQSRMVEDKKSFDTMMSILRSHGMSEADVYRNVVVSPDGRVNVNPNTMAVLSSVGNVSDALRLFDFVGWGAGKPVAAGARVAGRAAAGAGRRALTTVFKDGIPLPVPVGAGGIGVIPVGKIAARTTRPESNILVDLAAAKEAGLTRSTTLDTTKVKGTPGYTEVDKGKPVGSRAKLKSSAQGNDLRVYNEVYLMRDRLRSANKRAKNFDAGMIDVTSSISRREIRKAIERARLEYPDVWEAKGLEGFDLSHITPLEKGGKNAWSNLKLMPTEANLDQSIAQFSAWRYLTDPEKLALAGTRGRGLGKYALGQ